MKRFLVCLIMLTFLPALLPGETLFQIEYGSGDKFKIEQKMEFRRRINGKYKGFTFKNYKGILDVVSVAGGKQKISGDFYVYQETKRDGQFIANQVDKVIPIAFTLSPDGRYTVSGDSPYPPYRNFPLFPAKPLKPGDSWTDYAARYVAPLNDGIFTRVNIYCLYKYHGIDKFKGARAHMVTAEYALRFKPGDDPDGDPRLISIKNGGHKATIYFDLDNHKPIFMKDMITEGFGSDGGEVYSMKDGTQITLKGFIQTWYETIPLMNKEELIGEIDEEIHRTIVKDDIEEALDKEDITVKESEQGIQLTLPDIKFYPDSAKLLPGEEGRLDTIVKILSKIEDRTFLVTGHTADIGLPEGQYNLSVKRAKGIVDYLSTKGIPERRFLYQGKGALEPIAPNDTDDNRALNRRVEIMILED